MALSEEMTSCNDLCRQFMQKGFEVMRGFWFWRQFYMKVYVRGTVHAVQTGTKPVLQLTVIKSKWWMGQKVKSFWKFIVNNLRDFSEIDHI